VRCDSNLSCTLTCMLAASIHSFTLNHIAGPLPSGPKPHTTQTKDKPTCPNVLSQPLATLLVGDCRRPTLDANMRVPLTVAAPFRHTREGSSGNAGRSLYSTGCRERIIISSSSGPSCSPRPYIIVCGRFPLPRPVVSLRAATRRAQLLHSLRAPHWWLWEAP